MYTKPTKGIVVDCGCRKNPGITEIRGVNIETGKIVFEENLGIATNNIGEYCAIAYGAEYVHANNLNLPVYSDSKLCIHWVKNKLGCRTNIFRDWPDMANLNPKLANIILEAQDIIHSEEISFDLYFWDNKNWSENPADFGRK